MTNELQERNLTMLTDFYEITMANGYFKNGVGDRITQFDMFFRDVPDKGGFAVMAGVEQLADYLRNLKFTDDDLNYLAGKGFDKAFLDYLRDFDFCCDIWCVPEGTPIFPYEPIVTVRGPAIQAQFIETMILITINHQSLVATKANRIVRAAQGRPVMEFGSRRSQGYDGAIYGARAAYIGGCSGTACTISDREFGVKALGTMAHSWVQLFDSELDAFCAYAREYPDSCTLLVDTYNVLKSGIPNAIEAFRREVLPRGFRPKGIRIDSGDIAYLSRKARKMLDEAGFPDCAIVASNSLDEYIIRDMIQQGAKIDSFGVGERLITASSNPVFGGVYKLCAVENGNGEFVPKIKVSENVAKVTIPGAKKLWRLYDNETGKAIADLITCEDEVVDDSQPYELFDRDFTWKRKVVENYTARELLQPLFVKGKCVYEYPHIEKIKAYCKEQIDTLWDEVLRFENPHNYYVDLSQKLWDLKSDMLKQIKK
ncbi:MAG: nicotinate phosphoribosyltransferase [Clostridia bacterium]|nr:nicotinate phosphoribosyltransferase [Clostridia bacterium]